MTSTDKLSLATTPFHPPHLAPPVLQRDRAIVASLVAAVACVLASDALASRSPAERVGEQELSARVATIVERIRLVDPTLVRNVPRDQKIAQWRNY
jgi:hypothetical protein